MATKRKVFYSFHYDADNWRAAQVRNIGVLDGNAPASDNDWESIKGGGDHAIKAWIDQQMHGSSCTVVLVGSNTANRKWVTHEIVQSWNKGMGVVGVRVHGLQNRNGHIAVAGENPFNYAHLRNTGKSLSTVVKCYDPTGHNSKEKYAWISRYLSAAVEEAIQIRSRN